MKTKKIISAFLSLAMVLGSSAALSVHAADTTPDKYYLLQNGETQNGTVIDSNSVKTSKDETVKDISSSASLKWESSKTELPIKANKDVDFNEYASIHIRLKGEKTGVFNFIAHPADTWNGKYDIWKDNAITTDWKDFNFNLSDMKQPYIDNKYIGKLILNRSGWGLESAEDIVIYIDSMWLEKPSKNLTSEYMSGKFKYKYTDDTYTKVQITGFAKSATAAEKADLAIPETLDGNTVVSIADSAFRGENDITRVTIPKTMNSIATHSFEECKNLEQIVLHDDIEIIYSWAFSNTGIKEIELPKSLKLLHNDVFHYCKSLAYVDMSKMTDFTYIGDRCFNECPSLKEIYFPTLSDTTGRTLAADRIVGGFADFKTIIAYGSPDSYIKGYTGAKDATSGNLLYSFQPIMSRLNTTTNEDNTRNESYTIMLNGSMSSDYNSIRMKYSDGNGAQYGGWNLSGATEISGEGSACIGLLIKNLTSDVTVNHVSFSKAAIQ